MKTNMGNADRAIRVILAIVAAVLYFTGTVTGTWGMVLLVLGGIFLAVSAIGYCLLYAIFGINSCKNKK
ncbi:MAG: YgaP family membrane protein [Bacteroidota bacterium]